MFEEWKGENARRHRMGLPHVSFWDYLRMVAGRDASELEEEGACSPDKRLSPGSLKTPLVPKSEVQSVVFDSRHQKRGVGRADTTESPAEHRTGLIQRAPNSPNRRLELSRIDG